MTPYHGTVITEPPVLRGVAGQAWRIRMADVGHRARPDYDATIGMFLVNVPSAHVLWSYWIVSAIHLRTILGVKPAIIRIPGATHELMVVALNPERPLPALDVTPGWKVDFLTPIDITEQFTAANDAIADEILTLSVKAMVDGIASPDQDYRAWWKQALIATASHFAVGGHRVEQH